MTTIPNQTAEHQPPIEGMTCISRRPSWAAETRIDPEVITYSWTAPTIPSAIEADGEYCAAPVELFREDAMFVYENGVVLDPGAPLIYVLGTKVDVENARWLAQALLEACDRIEAEQ